MRTDISHLQIHHLQLMYQPGTTWIQSLLQGLLGSLEAENCAESPTQHTEALTLRWPALMPALSWRLRQPAGLLPALRTLDLSRNNLKGEAPSTAQE
jgi:hypothetical protein